MVERAERIRARRAIVRQIIADCPKLSGEPSADCVAALAAVGVNDDLCVIWSNEHRAYWRPSRCGYTTDFAQAGRYDRDKARLICASARGGWKPGKPPPEVPIRVSDALEVNRLHKAQTRPLCPHGEPLNGCAECEREHRESTA